MYNDAVVRYLIRRTLLTIPVLIGVATLVFALIHLVPGDPAQSMLGDGASAKEVEDLRVRLGLDRPLLEQYGRFVRGLLKGDLGTSFRTSLARC
jgi:ABC-type dipeptide/oligopeptide/nickel transport system permease component